MASSPEASITPDDRELLVRAVRVLERPNLMIRILGVLGKPVEKVIERLPRGGRNIITRAVRKSLEKGLDLVVKTIPREAAQGKMSRVFQKNLSHKAAVLATGATGGFFGLGGLSLELPVSTELMLRSIAVIAQEHGEDLFLIETRLACLEVFALGGRSEADDAAEVSYYLVRTALAREVAAAAAHIMERGLSSHGAPALVRFLTNIAARFSVNVSEKVAAQSIPVVGAVGGAAVNFVFMDFFQTIARAHFSIRMLERRYGFELVEREYRSIAEALPRKIL